MNRFGPFGGTRGVPAAFLKEFRRKDLLLPKVSEKLCFPTTATNVHPSFSFLLNHPDLLINQFDQRPVCSMFSQNLVSDFQNEFIDIELYGS